MTYKVYLRYPFTEHDHMIHSLATKELAELYVNGLMDAFELIGGMAKIDRRYEVEELA